jgi:septum formation protein
VTIDRFAGGGSPTADMNPRLILASTSPYRRDLLARLRLPFDVARPEVDETPRAGEPPRSVAQRLAAAKASAIARGTPNAWIIGSDQVAALGDAVLGKPGTRETAQAQLAAMSGRSVDFMTAVCVAHPDGRHFEALDTTTVRFRVLTPDAIARYIDAEAPYDCAGSFKSEGLGIVLFESIESTDPTGLIGLPLIATANLLRQAGYVLP